MPASDAPTGPAARLRPVNLLAFDTSTETLFLALAWDDAGVPRLREQASEGGRESSAALIPAVMGLLADAGLGLAACRTLCGMGPLVCR